MTDDEKTLVIKTISTGSGVLGYIKGTGIDKTMPEYYAKGLEQVINAWIEMMERKNVD